MDSKGMLSLGGYKFEVATAAYQELARSTGWEWAEQGRIGQRPALQFTGLQAETITLPGVIYPYWKGGLTQLPQLRRLADAATPLLLVSGLGQNVGRYVIERIDERQTVFFPNGAPRKIEFTITLKRYD